MTVRARKRFGQHFLHDPGVISRIVAAIDPQPDDRIVEIGPGLGALTLPLLDRAGQLEVIEIDRDLIPELRLRAAGRGELTVHNLDVLEAAGLVETTREGQDLDKDKLTLTVETNGAVSPEDALAYAARIIQDQLQVFVNFEEPRKEEAQPLAPQLAADVGGALVAR